MRPFALLVAIPFVLGCAQQSVMRIAALPSDERLEVRLYQPTAGALNYQLSEPAYVAIFAVTRGHGISMVFPHFQSQADYRSHAGFNQETVHGGSGAWGYSAGARYEHRALFGHADAYFVVASKYPLPIEGFLQAPFLLRSLIGADVFRATNLTDTWHALEALLVAGLPDDAWASDVYMNWRDPFLSVASAPERLFYYCEDRRSFYAALIFSSDHCGVNRATVSNTPAPVPVAEGPRFRPPEKPRDRDPHMPAEPPRIGPDDATARTSRSAIASHRSREESARTADREVRTIHQQASPLSPPSRPSDARPQEQPARPESKQPDPDPDD